MEKNARVVIELDSGRLLPLRDSRGVRVQCLEGALWLTQEDDGNDVVLPPGDSYSVESDGNTLVQAVNRARIAVDTPIELRAAA